MCFSAAWFVQLLVWLIVLCGLVAIFRILVPWVLGMLGWSPALPLFQILNIIIAVIVLVWLVWLFYDLFMCFGPSAMRLRP